MTTKTNSPIKAEARAKIARLQKSPRYKSFFTAAALDAFAKVEKSAFAGKSRKDDVHEIPAP
ncbi:hypothetical protein [Pseudomonas sp. AU10]